VKRANTDHVKVVISQGKIVYFT